MGVISRNGDYYQVAAPPSDVRRSITEFLAEHFPNGIATPTGTRLSVSFAVSETAKANVFVDVEAPTGGAQESAASRVRVWTNVSGTEVEAGNETPAAPFFDLVHEGVRQATQRAEQRHLSSPGLD